MQISPDNYLCHFDMMNFLIKIGLIYKKNKLLKKHIVIYN